MTIKKLFRLLIERREDPYSVSLYAPEDNLAIVGNAAFGSFQGEANLPAQLSGLWRHIQEQSAIIKLVLLVNVLFFALWQIFPVLMENNAAVGTMNWRAGRWWSILLHAFSHRDLVHLIGNMSFLLSIGSLLEKAVGGHVFASTIVCTPLVSGTITLLYRHSLAMMFPSIKRYQSALYATTIGFSGVVSAFACLYVFINPSLKVRYMHVNRHTTLYDLFTYWLWFDVFGIIVSTLFFSTGISHTSHLGGVFSGFIVRQALIKLGKSSSGMVSKETLQKLSRTLQRPVEAPPYTSKIFCYTRRVAGFAMAMFKRDKQITTRAKSRRWL
eukprot:gene27222-32889_t